MYTSGRNNIKQNLNESYMEIPQPFKQAVKKCLSMIHHDTIIEFLLHLIYLFFINIFSFFFCKNEILITNKIHEMLVRAAKERNIEYLKTG